VDRRTGSVLGRAVGGLESRGVTMRWEQVRCECVDRQCGCKARCKSKACYEWGSVDEGEWQFLCHRCCLRLVERGTPPYEKRPDLTPLAREDEDADRRPAKPTRALPPFVLPSKS
jgi:hypothetical protein